MAGPTMAAAHQRSGTAACLVLDLRPGPGLSAEDFAKGALEQASTRAVGAHTEAARQVLIPALTELGNAHFLQDGHA
jgi:hypothetical protein